MPPDDSTPHGREIMHEPPQRAKFPQPEPGAGSDERTHDVAPTSQRANDADAPQRPPLPDEPLWMAADNEDENAAAAGSDDGIKSLHKQKG